MMLTIHGLPLSTNYHDLKVMIKRECKINDIILDNLVGDGPGTKKVRVGVPDDREGSYLIKCFDGFHMAGHSLRVVPVGKPPPTAALGPPQNNYNPQGGFSQRNDYPNQPGYDYNRPAASMARSEPMMRPDMRRPDVMHGRHDNGGQPDPMHGRPGPMAGRPDPIATRPDPWGPTSSNNQWSNQSVPSQPHVQQNFNYQQSSQAPNLSYNQQRPDVRPYERESYPSRTSQNQGYTKAIIDPGPVNRSEPRAHVLRSVEIIDEPIVRQSAPGNRYPSQDYGMQPKPITIMKDNFQGPQYNMDRQAGPQSQYLGETHSPHALGHSQASPWTTPVQPEKPQHFSKTQSYNDPKPYDRKYQEPDKRPIMGKNTEEPPRSIHDSYSKGYDKVTGPKFSPRRDLPIDSHGRNDMPSGRRMSPSGRRISPPGRRMSPPGRRMSPSGRRMSPPGRRISPPGRRISPPGRRMSPPGRRVSPTGPRMSPTGRRMSPSGRRMSPSDRRGPRRDSPTRRPSPLKRPEPGHRPGSPGRLSPPRRDSPAGQAMRYSPSRRHEKLPDKYGVDPGRASSKEVRPAYEPPSQSSQAPKQAMYSGGYRPNITENVQYPLPGMRPQDRHVSPWQQDRDKTMFSKSMKKDDDRRDTTRIPKFEPRLEHQRTTLTGNMEAKKSRSPRKSRSPMRRDRSPLRERYKKHSPSPRSPRRSWALEKRRSPEMHDAPPPPVWPGQNQPENKQYRQRDIPNYPERVEDDKKRTPIWERPPFNDKIDRRERRPEIEDRIRRDENNTIGRSDLGPRQSMPQPNHSMHREPAPTGHGFKPEDRFQQRDTKFPPREEFPARRDDIQRSESDRKPYDRADFREMPPRIGEREHNRALDEVRSHHVDRKEDYPRQDEEGKMLRVQDQFQREIDDVYKRAVEFNKKAEEMRRRDSSRTMEETVEDRRRREMDRLEPKDYERQKWNQEEVRYRDEAQYREEPRHEFRSNVTKDVQTAQTVKREKAIEEIAQKILHKHGSAFNDDLLKRRVLEELRISLAKIMLDMFGNQDLSFIEMVVKFNAKFGAKDEAKIFDDVMSSFPSHYRAMKRPTGEHGVEVPAKIRRSPDRVLSQAKHDPGPVMKKPRMELHSQTNLKAIPRHHDMLRERRPIERERTSVIRDRRHVVHEKRLAPSQKYVRPVQVMRKTLPRSSETVSKEVKEKEGKGAQENPVKEKASADTEKRKDSNPDEHFELNPLMSRMLEAELQDIMIKIRKELPDGVTEAEKLVINKLKNEAGDDLRDVLGLNVTKRLLNVYNPLYVKAEFTRKTDPTSLKELLHKFNCEKLLSNNIIKMKNISDFDAICKAKNIRCGKAKVYIVPRYKFTQCPSKLKTIYNDVEAKKRRQNESEKNNCAENTENDKLSSESIVNKSHNANTNGAKNNDIKSKEVHNTAPENQTETPKDNKSVPTPIKTTAPQKNNTNASTATETVVSTPTKTVQAGTKTIPATKGGVASSANAFTPLTKVVVTKAESSSPKAKAATAVYTQRDKVQATTATKSVTTPNKAISKVAAKSVDTPGKAVAAAAANSVPAPAKAVAPAAAKSVATTSTAIAAAAAKSVPAPAKAVATAAAKSVATPSKAISDVAAKSVATPSKAVTTVTAKSISTPSKVVATVAAKSVASAAKAVATPTKAVAKPTKAVATPTKAVATPNKAVATITKDLNENRKGIANVTIKTKPAEGDLTSKKVTDPKKASKIIMTKNKKINQILASDNKNDDDELNDEDILALISEGIVLDECSGSDGE